MLGVCCVLCWQKGWLPAGSRDYGFGFVLALGGF